MKVTLRFKGQISVLLIAFFFVFICSPVTVLISADNSLAQKFMNILKIMMFSLGIIYHIHARVRSKMTWYVVIYACIYMLSTLGNGGNLLSAVNFFISLLSVYLWTEFFVCKYPAAFFDTYLAYIFFMAGVNLLTTFCFPDGLLVNQSSGYAIRLIGIDNSLGSILYPAIIISYLQYSRGEIKKRCVDLFLIVVIVTEVFVFSATSIIGLIPILWGYYLLNKKKQTTALKIGFWKIIIIYIITFFFVNVTLSNSALMLFVSRIFDKSLNFSGRTFVWQKTLDIISHKFPLLGFGYYNKELIQTAYFSPANTHSFLFELILTGGFIGTVLFFYMFYVTYKKALQYSSKSRELVNCFLCYLGTILVMGIAEASSLYLASFMFLAIFYHSDQLQKNTLCDNG